MRINLINQYIPPDSSPTARLLKDLGEGLQSEGHRVAYISGSRDYRSSARRGWWRLVRELIALWRIFFSCLFGKKPDWAICLSSPPCVLVPVSIACWIRRVPLVHWAMDVYPEIAVALGEFDKKSILCRFCQWAMRFAYARCAWLVALDADMAETLGAYHGDVRVLAPWAPSGILIPEKIRSPDSERFVWLYSGNLGRGHEWKTLLEAQKKLEEGSDFFHLMFQGGGPARKEAQGYAKELGLKNCAWMDYVAEEELVERLCRADILIATQRPEVRGLLWPSKLALALELERSILWIGAPDSAVALQLKERGEHGVFAPGTVEEVAEWIITMKERMKEHRKEGGENMVPLDLEKRVENCVKEGVGMWIDWLSLA